jgi:hypothetical protein
VKGGVHALGSLCMQDDLVSAAGPEPVGLHISRMHLLIHCELLVIAVVDTCMRTDLMFQMYNLGFDAHLPLIPAN